MHDANEADALYRLWRELATFPAGDAEAALRHLMQWIAREIDADNVLWIGGVRVLHGGAAKKDPFLGWRLRARRTLRPDPAAYRKQLDAYYQREHYGKLTPTYSDRSHLAHDEAHVGLDSRATISTTGRFRVHRIRDRDFLDFAAFRRTLHYRLYYRDSGIVDRFLVGFPIEPDRESFFMVDRIQKPGGPRRRLFSRAEAGLAGAAIRGTPELQRRLFLGCGLLVGDKLLSPIESQVLRGLLSAQTEKEIALALSQRPATLHKYVTALYARFGVKSRAALMALWLEGFPALPARPPSV